MIDVTRTMITAKQFMMTQMPYSSPLAIPMLQDRTQVDRLITETARRREAGVRHFSQGAHGGEGKRPQIGVRASRVE